MDHVDETQKSLINNMHDCMDFGGDWIRLDQNFDNIFQSMLTMFVVALTEGWIEIMFQGIDSKGPEQYKTRDFDVKWAIFFCMFIVIGTFFTLNLFDGIIINNYQKA